MEKRYQVFLSSTYKDLIEERDAVTKAIWSLKCFVAGMKNFAATNEAVFEHIKKQIDDSDYYLLIIGKCYGSVGDDGYSYTEKEFDYAASKNKHIIAFLIDDTIKLSEDKIEQDKTKKKKLTAFRKKVADPEKRIVTFWKTKNDLELSAFHALTYAINYNPMTGWIRGDAAAGVDILNELNVFRKENDRLRKEMQALNPHYFSDIASINDSHTIDVRIILDKDKNEITRTIEFVWEELFSRIADSIIVPKPLYRFKALLERFLAPNVKDIKTFSHLLITEEDTRQIYMQFFGFELIEVNSGKDDVSRRDAIIINISEKGKRLLASQIIIKKEQYKS